MIPSSRASVTKDQRTGPLPPYRFCSCFLLQTVLHYRMQASNSADISICIQLQPTPFDRMPRRSSHRPSSLSLSPLCDGAYDTTVFRIETILRPTHRSGSISSIGRHTQSSPPEAASARAHRDFYRPQQTRIATCTEPPTTPSPTTPHHPQALTEGEKKATKQQQQKHRRKRTRKANPTKHEI